MNNLHTNETIGVGLIGVSPGRGWAATAHIPALRALPGYELRAVCSSSPASAQRAAEAFGIPAAADDAHALAALPEVDLVVVTVKVPHHRELVSAALAAGKTVYCEWPLGVSLDESVNLAAAAAQVGVRTAVGLQARSAPVFRYVRDLVAQGYVGEVLSASVIGSGMGWGGQVEAANAYTLDKATGASMLMIPLGHTVDALCACLGEFREVTATTALRQSMAAVVGTEQTVAKTTEDQVAFAGTLDGGALVSVHYRGGASRGTNLLIEINGTEGDLQITAAGGHAQIFDLAVLGGQGAARTLSPLDVPDTHRTVPPELKGPAVNVAQTYVRLQEDLRQGTHECPNFADAVRRHRLLDAVETAARTGTRVRVEPRTGAS